MFDAAKLDEILTNLLANALRFTPAGGTVYRHVLAELGTDRVNNPAGSVEIAVHDTGTGIPIPTTCRICSTAFTRPGITSASDGQRMGTGIGLALVRELAALHGGSVRVASPPGQGALRSRCSCPRACSPTAGYAENCQINLCVG